MQILRLLKLELIYLIEKIKDKYYQIIPYDYRPSKIWYKIKCYFFKRYSTVKSRYLPHTWTDRDNLLLHTAFEIFSQYIEKESGNIDWHSEMNPSNKILIGEKEEYVIDVLMTIYNWYHNEYVPYYLGKNKQVEEIWQKIESMRVSNNFSFSLYDVYGDNYKEVKSLFRQLHKIDEDFDKQAEEMLCLLFRLRRYLWS